MEKQLEGELPWYRKLQFKAHLHLCKICAAYYDKASRLHNALKDKHIISHKKHLFEDSDIQKFKEQMKEKMKK